MVNCSSLSTFIENLWGSGEPVTVFFGTGISIASGNLSAEDTRRIILELIFQESPIEETDRKEIFEAIIKQMGQFEDFLMRIFDDLDNDSLKTQYMEALEAMYIVPNPKDTHAFLSVLKERKLCSCFVTTNYDLHLENQIGEDGLNIIVHDKLNDFNKNVNGKPLYLKIHGCVKKQRENGDFNMAMFLPNVSDCKVNKEIANALEYVFFNSISKKVLFLGYSFSDVYDIVKWMNKNCKKSTKQIFIVAHDAYSCKLFESAQEYNIHAQKPTRNIPEFRNCEVFLGPTERFVKESLDFLHISRPQEYKGKISQEKYIADSKVALIALFQKLNSYGKYRDYYSILLRHQFLYEVARCCLVTGLEDLKTKEAETVRKCYFYAMNEIQTILNLIETLDLSPDEKEYRKCLNLRHRMFLEILGHDFTNGKKTYKYIMGNMPKSNRNYVLMRLRTIFDYIVHWYIARLIYKQEKISSYHQESLNAEWKLINSFPGIGLKITSLSATPTSDEFSIEEFCKLFNNPSMNHIAFDDIIIYKREAPLSRIYEYQYKFVKEIFQYQSLSIWSNLPSCINGFHEIGRPEYEAQCKLIFGYLLNNPKLICQAKNLFNDLGYNFGDKNGSYLEQLCKMAIEFTQKIK